MTCWPEGYDIDEVEMMELGFKHNLGLTDRVIRGIVAFYLFISGLSMSVLPVWGHLILFVLGIALFFEAATGY